jgi:hypothetical protein
MLNILLLTYNNYNTLSNKIKREIYDSCIKNSNAIKRTTNIKSRNAKKQYENNEIIINQLNILFAVGFSPAPWGGSMLYCNRYAGSKPHSIINYHNRTNIPRPLCGGVVDYGI